MMQAFNGVACGIARGYRFRWFVLTESDLALSLELDFWKEFHRFITWLKKKCGGVFEYIVVEHRQGLPTEITGEPRRNWHILSFGSDRLPILAMREYWLEHYKSTVTGMAEVADPGRAVRYLAGYLAKEDKFCKSRMSHGWVWPGWVRDTRAYWRTYKKNMTRDDIAWLASLGPTDRAREIGWAISEGFE